MLTILGDRILVSKIEEEKKEGFQTVEIQDSFLYKGRVVQLGDKVEDVPKFVAGSVVLFAKYSPHTQTVTINGQEMKVIRTEDVIAVE